MKIEEMLKRVLGAGVLAALASGLGAGLSAAPAAKVVAGVIIDVKGVPMLKAAADGKKAKLKLQQYVYNKDVIKTEKGERVAIAFVGGAEMRINENSEFAIESGGGSKPTSVYTKAGDAWTRLLHGSKGAGFNVRSPLAVAAVRGTEADIDVGARMTVKVYEGLVDIQNAQGLQSLRAGQMSQVGAGQAPAPPRAMSPGDFATWQGELKPQGVDAAVDRLKTEADKNRTLNLRFKGKDGVEKSLDIKLKKK